MAKLVDWTITAECDLCGDYTDIVQVVSIPDYVNDTDERLGFCAHCREHGDLEGQRTVIVKLSADFRETCMGYVPGVEYVTSFVLIVDDDMEPLEACELAYALCNSYPGELHVAAEYSREVELYRRFKNRSLSVGDVVSVDGVEYSVDDCGFSQVSA